MTRSSRLTIIKKIGVPIKQNSISEIENKVYFKTRINGSKFRFKRNNSFEKYDCLV